MQSRDLITRGQPGRLALSLISRCCLQESDHATVVVGWVDRRSGRARSLSLPGKITPIRGTSAVSRTVGELVSIVVPVFNESANLSSLWSRLKPVLDGLDRPWETIFVDDGSRDDSLGILREIAAGEEGRVRVVELARNFGQHSAILAGFRQSRGEIVVTLDADLQNPPEEIPRLIAAIDEGNDVVGGWREERHDQAYRRYASRLQNRLTSLVVGVPMHDYGCMLRAYRRHIVETVVDCDEKAAFVPALANTFAKRVAEIPGRSRRSRKRRVEVQPVQFGEAESQPDHRIFADSDPDAEHDRDRNFVPGRDDGGRAPWASADLRPARRRRAVDAVRGAVLLHRDDIPGAGADRRVRRTYLYRSSTAPHLHHPKDPRA